MMDINSILILCFFKYDLLHKLSSSLLFSVCSTLNSVCTINHLYTRTNNLKVNTIENIIS
jgi:hypothetical protein